MSWKLEARMRCRILLRRRTNDVGWRRYWARGMRLELELHRMGGKEHHS